MKAPILHLGGVIRLAVTMALLLAGASGRAAEVSVSHAIRVLTYNIHHGEGLDGRLDIERIADVIRAEKADIVALQEVDRGTRRVRGRDLLKELADRTGMHFLFGASIDFQGGEYGNGLLTRFDIVRQANTRYRVSVMNEQRGLLQAVLDVHGRQILVLNTHLDFHKEDSERLANLEELGAIVASYPTMPVILCGDFNDVPGSATYRKATEAFVDAWTTVGQGVGFTIPAASPRSRIDYIFLSPGPDWTPLKARVIASKASDHLPVLMELKLGVPRDRSVR